ncbi:MAG: septum formation initiator family protein [Lachnospiraceae bacterium]|nr:septum formation initiator family protein [Lachnospiraceae bacterium]MBP5414380.1 septum formation initiator family protein [Lachnospiraceae bacterium]MBP5745788.1 septum formation initiator family protein [Lachnospiraceae bacterium]
MSNRYLRVRRKQNRFSVMLIIIVLIMLMAVVSYNKHNLRTRCESYQKQEEMLLEQIAKEQERSEEIAEYAKYTKTKKYAEEVAKEKLGLVNENEIIFKTEN